MISNKCYYYKGSTVYIENNSSSVHTKITLEGCTFFNNAAVRGAAVCIVYQNNNTIVATIEKSTFNVNIADESV